MDRRITLVGFPSSDSSNHSKLNSFSKILKHQGPSNLTESESKSTDDSKPSVDSFKTVSFLSTPTSTSTTERLAAGKGNDASINHIIKITALNEDILKDNWHPAEFEPSDTPTDSDIHFGKSLCEMDLLLKKEKSIPVVSLQDFGNGHEDKEVEKAWSQLKLPKKTPLVQNVIKFLLNNETPDMKVLIGEHQFSCYHAVLMCYSEYFMELKPTSQLTLPSSEVTPSAFEIIYAWMLDANGRAERNHIIEVLNAATYLGIKDLERQIWFCIDSPEYFVEIEAYVLFLELVEVQMQPLIERVMLTRITKFFLTLTTTLEYLSFSPKHIVMLLSSDYIGVNTEKEVLFAAVLWLNHDWPTRAAHLNEILSSIRMMYLPISYLMHLKKPSPYVAMNRIIESEEFKSHLNETIFARTLTYYGGESESFSEIYKRFNITLSLPRIFIYDPHCPYHKPNPNDEQVPIEYLDFVNYLRTLQVEGQLNWEKFRPVKIENYKPC